MILAEAINIIGLTEATVDGIHRAYKAYALRWHPDRQGGDVEMMKLGNVARDMLIKHIEFLSREFDNFRAESETFDNIPDILQAVLSKIIRLEGLYIEICGTWIWVSGNTRPYKDFFKSQGFRWAPKKCQWYFTPSPRKRFRHREFTMEEIRERYASTQYDSEGREKIA